MAKQENFNFSVLKPESFKVKVSVGLIPPEASLRDLQMAALPALSTRGLSHVHLHPSVSKSLLIRTVKAVLGPT